MTGTRFRMQCSLLAGAVVAVLTALAACQGARVAPLEVDEEEIRAADGSEILRIDEVPDNIRPDESVEFGAAQRFTGASASPDESWIAIATSSASHGAGWLVRIEDREPRPAAFQFGGRILAGPWSDDSRHAVFVHEGPAGDRTLTMVDREDLGDTVQESAMLVRLPDHDDRLPEHRIYEGEEWRNTLLAFQVADERWLFDTRTGEVSRDD